MLNSFSPEKIEQLNKLQALWSQQCALERDVAAHAGGVQWKSVKGRDYLIHYFSDPSTGKRRFESRGPRSPETEAWREQFLRRREELERQTESVALQLRIAAATAKILKVGRAPAATGEIFRSIWRSELRDQVVLVGSFALLAYETQTRASIPPEVLTMPEQRIDVDFFLSDELAIDAFERVLRSADSSFRRASHGDRRFENRTGLVVDCFSCKDLAEISERIYGRNERVAESFLAAANSEPVEGLIVDRSGMIAPVQVLSLQNFITLKAIRAAFDPLRSDGERAFDAKQAETAEEIAEKLEIAIHNPVAEGEFGEPDDFDGGAYRG